MTKLPNSILMATFAALTVMPSVASASPELTQPTGTRASAGNTFIATNVEHAATNKVVKFTTPITTIECATATLTGTLTSNTGTHIAGEITTVEVGGKPNEGIHGVHCTSSLGNVTITPNHTTNPTHNGVSSLPWCATASTLNDKISIRGGKCSEAARSVTFTMHTAIAGTCTFQRASLTATYTTHPAEGLVTLDTGQPFTKTTGGGFCPTEGALDMALTVASDVNGTSGEPLYVD